MLGLVENKTTRRVVAQIPGETSEEIFTIFQKMGPWDGFDLLLPDYPSEDRYRSAQQRLRNQR